MFQELLKRVSADISTVHAIIQTNDRLREIMFGEGAVTRQETELTILRQHIPGAMEWRVYDHCAVVTRLYAIYERFIKDLISDWLQLLPDIFPLYTDLEETIQNTHRTGVGRLLCDLKKKRFEHLSIDEIIRGLLCGVTGEEEYVLLPDAFLLQQNLWKGVLEQLFNGAGIPDAWRWVEKHRAIKDFVEKILASENTAEGELKELISYRNDAAHGSPIDNVLGSNTLIELCYFVESLCQALAELVTYKVFERQKLIGLAREIGQITEWFKNPRAVVAKVEETTLSVGGILFLVGEAHCQLATIESIQIDGVENNEVRVINGREVGLKFDVDARKKLRLYILE